MPSECLPQRPLTFRNVKKEQMAAFLKVSSSAPFVAKAKLSIRSGDTTLQRAFMKKTLSVLFPANVCRFFLQQMMRSPLMLEIPKEVHKIFQPTAQALGTF